MVDHRFDGQCNTIVEVAYSTHRRNEEWERSSALRGLCRYLTRSGLVVQPAYRATVLSMPLGEPLLSDKTSLDFRGYSVILLATGFREFRL